jgi:acid stress-induced BolA-like protein IbaG/YrbA
VARLIRRPLLRKVREVLTRRFPSPARVRLEDHDGLIGAVTSDEFAGMSTIDRQNLIGKVLASNLSREEQRRVQVIVGVTPDEETGYLAG